MSVLMGAVPGASSRLSGGLAMVAGLMVGEVQPTALQIVRPSIGQNLGPNLGRFRRHFSGFTTDILNAPLPAALVLIFDTTTRILFAAITSDASGFYDVPMYIEGTTYFMYTNKAGSPEVFGGSSNQLVPV